MGRENVKGSPMVHNVFFKGNYVKFSALIDSGADVSCIDSNIFHKLNKNCISNFSTYYAHPLRGVSGQKLNIIGQATLYTRISGVKCTVVFKVIHNIGNRIILGSDFLSDHKIKLDFEGNTMTFKNKVILLHNKYARNDISLVAATTLTVIRPYSVQLVPVKPRRNLIKNTYTISPIDTCPLFLDQPGLTSPNILLEDCSNRNETKMIIENNTAYNFTVRKGAVIGLAERVFGKRQINDTDHQINSINAHTTHTTHTAHTAHTINHNKATVIERIQLSDDISEQDKMSLRGLIDSYSTLFNETDGELPKTNITEATLDTGDHKAIRSRPYRTPLAYQKQVDIEIDKMLKNKTISVSDSNWASPLVVVPKKNGGIRPCIDYRKINNILKDDRWPIPRIDDIFAKLAGTKYYTTLDARNGFFQIPMAVKDRHKTAFCTHNGLFQFNCLPFGLKIGPSVFQRMISKVLKGIEGDFAISYLDDILIFSDTFESHLKHIEEVFKRLKSANLRLGLEKCCFVRKKIDYLGHVLSAEGISPNPEKVRVIKEMKTPTTVRQIRSFLGTISYYRSYINHFSKIARPLTQLTKKNARFHWSTEANDSFEYLKDQLCKAPILAYPVIGQPYSLYTDASDYAVGGVLTQLIDGKREQVIQYVSHQLTPNRLAYPTIEKEAFAIIYCITKLKQYLLGSEFTIYTDHKPLKSLFTAEMNNTRIQRWAILLAEYGAKIEYCKGVFNVKADMVSRLRATPISNEISESDEIFVIENDVVTLERPQINNVSDLDENYNIKQAQRKDSHCKAIVNLLESNKKDKLKDEYVVLDELLYHIAKPNRYENNTILQLVIPHAIINNVLNSYHGGLVGHMSFEKTYQRLRCKYFWPNSYKDTVEYVSKCETCNRRTLRRKRAELQENNTPELPFEVVGIDLVGPYPTSVNGNKYILTVVDWYSGWIEGYPIPSKEAEVVAQVLSKEFISRHSCPKIMVSDRGSEFCNAAIDLLTTQLKIKRIVTSPFHPASNGRTEIKHKTLNDLMAKALQQKSHSDWEDVLAPALFAMRTCIGESTKFSSFFLIYGRDPTVPMDTILAPRRRYYGDDFVPTYLSRLHNAFSIVAKSTKEARERSKIQADKNANNTTFKIGDAVYLWNPVLPEGQIKKLHSPWQPYYRIVEMTTPVSAIIRSHVTGKTRAAHVNNLRLASYITDEWDFNAEVVPKPLAIQNKRAVAQPCRVQPHRAVKSGYNYIYNDPLESVLEDNAEDEVHTEFPSLPFSPLPDGKQIKNCKRSLQRTTAIAKRSRLATNEDAYLPQTTQGNDSETNESNDMEAQSNFKRPREDDDELQPEKRLCQD